jgi:hypothetical protein
MLGFLLKEKQKRESISFQKIKHLISIKNVVGISSPNNNHLHNILFRLQIKFHKHHSDEFWKGQ